MFEKFATRKEIQAAKKLGYTCKKDLVIGDRFTNGRRVIWSGLGEWITANRWGGRYSHHQSFSNLIDALHRSLVNAKHSRVGSRPMKPNFDCMYWLKGE